MIETYLRPIYQYCVVNPIARKIQFSPIKITCFSCFTGILVAPALLINLPKIAIVLLLISGFLDTLDGTVARMTDKTSNMGGVLDIVSDRIVELAVMIGLYFVDPSDRALGTLAMLGSCYLCITSFLVVGIFSPNQSEKGFHYSPGLIERTEAFIFFIVMILWPRYFSLLAYLFAGLVLLTSFLHIKAFNRKLVLLPSSALPNRELA